MRTRVFYLDSSIDSEKLVLFKSYLLSLSHLPRIKLFCLIVWLILPVLLYSQPSLANPIYAVYYDGIATTPIGLPGWNSRADGINDNSIIIGHYYEYPSGAARGFKWENGVIIDLPLLQGYDSSWASDINESGVIVGGASLKTTVYEETVFWKNDVITGLGTFGSDRSAASAINNNNVIVGNIPYPGGGDAFLWAEGQYSILENPGYARVSASDINDFSQVVGSGRRMNSDEIIALFWDEGNTIELPGLGGSRTEALAINQHGRIAGGSYGIDGNTHAVVWDSDGTLHDLGTLGGLRAIALDINDAGMIVGWIHYGDHLPFNERYKGYSLYEGQLTLLDDFSYATSINNHGEIVGLKFGTLQSTPTPVPAPPSVLFMASGLVVFAIFRRKVGKN